MKIETKELTRADAKQIARLHILAFPNFFLTTLGEQFLITFYKKTIQDDCGYGVGVFFQKKLISFAIGTNQISGFYKLLIFRYGMQLFISAFPVIILKPKSLLRIFKNLTNNQEEIKPQDGGWLLSICTDPQFHGAGISQKCITSFEDLSIKHNLKQLWLTTDSLNNQRANLFYKKLNYNLVSTFNNANKRKMNLYTKILISK